MNWQITNNTFPNTHQELEDILLENLKIEDTETFFNPPKPFDLKLKDLEIDEKQVKKAIKTIKGLNKEKDQIIVFGDYDADGITATAIMWRILYDLGYKVKPFIPDRIKHGYGLTPKAIDDLYLESEPKLIITVDNGIVAHEAIDYLNEKKCPIIITDHHLPEEELPKATAIVHSTKVAGAGVSWILSREILKDHEENINKVEQTINKELDLCGIATIADQMPMTDFNRAFAYWGVKQLQKSNRLGLQELLENSKIIKSEINASTVNFALAPRINAMGRLSNGIGALRLLCTPNRAQAKTLAKELSDTNVRRQDITFQQIKDAQEQVKEQIDENLLIVQSDDFHEGVIGLIAGKLSEKYHKPAIVIAIDGETAKASARSIPGVNIIELIRTVKDDLLAAGGHPMAAGFGVEVSKIKEVKQKLQQEAQKLDHNLFERNVELACNLPLGLVDEKTYDIIQKFQPFGQKNREPIFGLNNLTIVEIKKMGKKEEHLKLFVKDNSENSIQIIFWRQGFMGDQLTEGEQIKVAGLISINKWRNRVTMQVIGRGIEKEEI
ncbi:MAG: single-stranded-DNA-specific exonuclease RecJ [Candidatus Pacebacteria bacterium]|nr:single-stranded-DNA-specific exonuclease RecJ [Candidatus Paceibacterota bacterium]